MSRFWSERQNFVVENPLLRSVTLIVPFRNEAANIPDLVSNLLKISYKNLEILLVDDHSTDGSADLLRKDLKDKHEVKILRSLNNGKKSALEYGVNAASGQIILCTDADCSFPELWIEKMITPFQNPAVQLVAGAVMVQGTDKFLDVFQSIDWASILLTTNYSFAIKRPLMCSGANLAYRREAFLQVNGYDGNREIKSGDDEFLLKKIHITYGEESCFYFSSSEVLVTTKPEVSWHALINQRVRWASKWRAHFSVLHALSAILAFGSQLVWLGSLFLIPFGKKGMLVFGLVWLMKVSAEKLSLGKVLESIGRKPTILSILKTSFVHPIYVLQTGIGAVRGKFMWKGREN